VERLTDVARAAGILRAGGVVAFPTDTVYGLGGATDAAVRRIYELKGRAQEKPLVLMGADVESLMDRVQMSPIALRYMRRFWPGPLTLVLRSSGGSVGVRVPDLGLARDLLRASGPLWTTSANRSGYPDTMSADEVAAELPDLDAVLDGGRAPGDVPSTVLDLSGPRPVVLREGAIPLSDLAL
jgi:L-threonylcarbamoyladenylate synthase